MRMLAVGVGVGLLIAMAALAFRVWDNRRERVHTAEQAIEMARAEAGPQIAKLPMHVRTEQDFWVIRFGPDQGGATYDYMVTIWDKRAGRYSEVTVEADLSKPR